MSSPSRGTWIEIWVRIHNLPGIRQSSPSRGTWIEIVKFSVASYRTLSSPSRGTWIEIALDGLEIVPVPVVPLTGDVD